MAATAKRPSRAGRVPGALKEITVVVKPNARLDVLQRSLGDIFTRLGCQGCTSGLDRITISSRVLNRIR